jgi:BirA family biotin operon repressor/biotin-[acetyl-CoA-carboxylase] ligase
LKESLFEQSAHYHFEQLDSTNNYASTIAKLPETLSGTAITADFQVEGRGQRDNKWLAEAGTSFLGTLILKTPIKAEDIFYLSKWSALQVAKTLLQLEIKKVQIKWPNDIYVEGKKIGGILIENSWSDQQLHYSLIGIGLNFSTAPIGNATCLSKYIKEIPSVSAFLNLLRKQMTVDLFLLEEKKWEEIDRQYHNLLFQKNENNSYQIAKNDEVISGKIIRVEADGKLVIERDDQSLLGFYMKEIIFI